MDTFYIILYYMYACVCVCVCVCVECRNIFSCIVVVVVEPHLSYVCLTYSFVIVIDFAFHFRLTFV